MDIKFMKNNSKRTQSPSNGSLARQKADERFPRKVIFSDKIRVYEYCRIRGTDDRRRNASDKTTVWCGFFGDVMGARFWTYRRKRHNCKRKSLSRRNSNLDDIDHLWYHGPSRRISRDTIDSLCKKSPKHAVSIRSDEPFAISHDFVFPDDTREISRLRRHKTSGNDGNSALSPRKYEKRSN